MNSRPLPEHDPWARFWTLVYDAARELDRKEKDCEDVNRESARTKQNAPLRKQ